MVIRVEGVKIELTAGQIALIEKDRKKRQRCINSFDRMLRHFGFKKMDTTGWLDPSKMCYEHSSLEWFAEIIEFNSGWHEVWMVGEGLKTGIGFMNDGWMYGDPQEIAKEIIKALDELPIK